MSNKITKKTRNRQQKTTLAFHARRMNLTLKDLEKITKEPYGNIKNWNQGRRRTPRVVIRMLAAYRLLHWGKY